MSESEAALEDLHKRISAAMDRIGKGIDVLERPAPPAPEPAAAPEPEAEPVPEAEAVAEPEADPGEVEALRAALEEERLANAQLEERVRAIKQRQDGAVADLRSSLEEQRKAMAGLDAELQSLRAANDKLRASNRDLREANAKGLTEAGLIDAALAAEVESLAAARRADRAEADAILAALSPLMTNAAEPPVTADATEEDS